MARSHGSRSDGRTFTDADVSAVWAKGVSIPGYDASVWRRDVCGKPMKRQDYGNINSQHGWEIDHIKPVSKGGSDDLGNLQPLQWENNRRKGDTFPWSC